MAEDFEGYVGFLLVQVMKAHRGVAEAGLSRLGLHVGQEMILFKLWCENGVSQSELAEHLCVEPPTITKMVQRMEAGGLVERRPDPDDGRVSRVFLTEESRQREADVRAVWRDLEARTLAGMSDMERALLRRLLMQVLDNLTTP